MPQGESRAARQAHPGEGRGGEGGCLFQLYEEMSPTGGCRAGKVQPAEDWQGLGGPKSLEESKEQGQESLGQSTEGN